MKIQTPLQELLTWVRATLPMDLETPIMIEEKIESLLEKEEEVIIDAVKYGCSDWGRRTLLQRSL